MGVMHELLGGTTRGAVAGGMGAPVDAATLALNALLAGGGYAGHKMGLLQSPPGLIENPVGGSEWIAGKMRGMGLLNDTPGTTADNWGIALGGLLGPLTAAKAPQIARGLLQMGENAAIPQTLNRQAGVLSLDLKNELLSKYQELAKTDPYGHYGVRVFSPSQKSDVGTKLARSSNWVDGVPKSTKLPGTAVFQLLPRDPERAINAALKYNLGVNGAKVGIVRGEELASHKMPEAFSALIKSPVVKHIYDWPSDL